MKVLCTGSRGFIATNLLKIYPDADRLDLKDGQDVCHELPDKNYDIVFHLAAKHHIPTCEKEPEATIRTNCWGTLNVVKSYPKSRILVAASSSSNEVKSVYGASKAFSEIIAPLHPNYLAVKFYNVFGEHQTLEGGAVTPKIIHAKLTGKPFTVFGDGTQTRDFTYVGDLVENLKILAESNDKGSTHIGYGDPITLNDFIKMIYGYQPEVINTPRNPLDIWYSKSPLSCTKFYGRAEGIRRTLAWYETITS